MKTLSRRLMLKQLATLPIVSSSILSLLARNRCQGESLSAPAYLDQAKPHPCDPNIAGPNAPGVNVFLHGLFLISPKGSSFSLYAPVVANPNAHVYMAGKWKHEKFLKAKSKISLQGIKAGMKPSFSPTDHFIIPQATANKFDANASYFSSFDLPFPTSPTQLKLRRKLPKPKIHEFFLKDATHDDLGMTPTSVPLVYVFVYPQSQFINGAAGVKLTMDFNGTTTTVWPFSPNPSDFLSYDLHIHASPDHCPDLGHLGTALNSVNKMFNPNTKLELFDPRASFPTTLNCTEEKSLAERQGTCTKDLGGEVANCMAFILGD